MNGKRYICKLSLYELAKVHTGIFIITYVSVMLMLDWVWGKSKKKEINYHVIVLTVNFCETVLIVDKKYAKLGYDKAAVAYFT
jgi:hypothetical protein